MENSEKRPEDIERDRMLDTLEKAFEKNIRAKVTISEPGGESRTAEVLIEGFEDGMLFVSSSESSPVLGININDVKGVELPDEPEK